MKRKNKNIRRGLHNIPDYLSGKLRGIERNAFERLLQKDDFASEAIEGLSGLSAEQFQKDISLLESKIVRRTDRYRRRIIYRVAASIAVLMIVSSVFLVVERNKSSLKVENGTVSYLEITRSYPVTKAEPEKTSETNVNSVNIITDTETKGFIGSVKEEIVETQEQILSEAEEQKEDLTLQINIADKFDAREPEILSSKGRVIDAVQEVSPAPSAVRSESASSKMQPMKEEESVFVVGYGAMKAKSAIKGEYSQARPIIGIDSFNLYLRRNLILHDSLQKKEAEITAGFRVLKDGTIDSIRIIQTPDRSLSGKIIKLIKEGPAWQAAEKNGKPVDDDVTISINIK